MSIHSNIRHRHELVRYTFENVEAGFERIDLHHVRNEQATMYVFLRMKPNSQDIRTVLCWSRRACDWNCVSKIRSTNGQRRESQQHAINLKPLRVVNLCWKQHSQSDSIFISNDACIPVLQQKSFKNRSKATAKAQQRRMTITRHLNHTPRIGLNQRLKQISILCTLNARISTMLGPDWQCFFSNSCQKHHTSNLPYKCGSSWDSIFSHPLGRCASFTFNSDHPRSSIQAWIHFLRGHGGGSRKRLL